MLLPEEERKHCFWLNMINFAIIHKLYEIKVAKPKELDQLKCLTKFFCLLTALTIKVNRETISVL